MSRTRSQTGRETPPPDVADVCRRLRKNLPLVTSGEWSATEDWAASDQYYSILSGDDWSGFVRVVVALNQGGRPVPSPEGLANLEHIRLCSARNIGALLDELTTLRERPYWRCFCCDEVFEDRRAAADHFGVSEDSEPACRIAHGAERSLLGALRRAEADAAAAWAAIGSETTDAVRAYSAQSSRHAEQLRIAEELGYERGLRDGRAEQSAG